MSTSETKAEGTAGGKPEFAEHHQEQQGYQKSLKHGQIQMIAIGGAIGTGLFLGAGGRLHSAGPALIFSYAIAGFFAFIILRALGELVLHRPSSGSFVSYAREFFGEKAAYAAGWLYWLNWAVTSVVDSTAIALYVKFFGKYWAPVDSVPQWLIALLALALVMGLNLVSVKVFGAMEFWFALIKVAALVIFLLVGIYFVIFGTPVHGQEVGFGMLFSNGGFLPNGVLPAVLVMSGVVFAYAGIELVGTAAGETEKPADVIPKAVNTVIVRIAIFYVGTVLLLALLLPYTSYKENESPFVTFFGSIGIQGIDVIMDLVVLTAALSSLNAGLYSTGRILRSMSLNGSAPKFAARMNKAGVPYGGIAITALVGVLGVILNALFPGQAFEIVLNLAAIGIIGGWGTIVLCHARFVQWSKKGWVTRPSFRLFAAPAMDFLTLVFLAAVLVLMAFDYPVGTFTIGSLIIIVPALIGGWFYFRGRIIQIAKEREGYTGTTPVIANRPSRPERQSSKNKQSEK